VIIWQLNFQLFHPFVNISEKNKNKTEKSFSNLAASQFCYSRSNKSTTTLQLIVALLGCVIVALQGCIIVALQGCVIVLLQDCVIVALQCIARLLDCCVIVVLHYLTILEPKIFYYALKKKK
jgi:hypothetical protein